MSEFKKDDKVRRVRGGEHVGMKEGDVGTVAGVMSSGNLIIEEFQRAGWSHSAENFELVTGPQWSDVEVGDRVTARHHKTGDEVVLTAYASGTSGSPLVLDSFTGHKGTQRIQGLELVSIEKPKPQPPTTPGSHVTVLFPGWESGINHLFLLNGGKWLSQSGAGHWSAEDVAAKGFTVIHDAGATS